MTRTVNFDSERRFELIYNGVMQGAIIAQQQYAKENQRPLPFDKQRLLARIVRKLKSISPTKPEDVTRRDFIPGTLNFTQEEFDHIIMLYEKVDWVPSIVDEVVDVHEWFSSADKVDG